MPESFGSILEELADQGRERMRPFPAESVHALGRARKRRRNALTAVTAAFVVAAVAAGISLGTAGRNGSAPIVPGRSSTPGVVPPSIGSGPSTPGQSDLQNTGAAWSVPANFLQPGDLPGPLHWTSANAGAQSTAFKVDECGQNLQPIGQPEGRASHAVSGQSVRYIASPVIAEEDVYTYDSAAAATADYLALKPDPGKCAGSEDGPNTSSAFGWTVHHATADPYRDHVLAVTVGKYLAVFILTQWDAWQPQYDSANSGKLLTAMAGHLGSSPIAASEWLTPADIPFGDGKGWAAGAPSGLSGSQFAPIKVTDVCASASQPINTSPDVQPGVVPSLQDFQSYGPLNPADVTPASESLYIYGTTGQALSVYHQAAKLAADQSCHFTTDTVGRVDSTVTLGTSTTTGFSVSISEKWVQQIQTGTMAHFHTYVVIKGNVIAVLLVPSTKAEAADTSHDAAMLAAMRNHLP